MKRNYIFPVFFVTVIIYGAVFLFTHTTLAQTNTQTNLEKLQLTFPVNFTDKEKKFINSLSQTDLEKLIRVIKLIVEKNKAAQQSTRTQSLASTTTYYSNSPSPQTPHYNSSTGQYQSTPASGGGSNGSSNLSGSQQNPYSNNLPFSGQPQSAAPSTPLGAFAQGLNQGMTQVEDEQLKKLFPDGGKGGKCEDFGAVNRMGGQSYGGIAALSAKLKFDLSRLCQLTGKRIVVTSGRRSTGSGYHPQGAAIDTAMEPYTEEEKVIVTLYFMAHGYGGIGSYGNQPMHFDHRNFSMRWGPPAPYRLEYCKASNYYPAVQKAFQLVGVPPCATPDVSAVTAKAKEVLINLNKKDFSI